MAQSKLGKEIIEGLEQAIAFKQGEKVPGLRVDRVYIQPIHVLSPEEIKAKRKALNISIPVFAEVLGVKSKTVESWEYGKRHPNSSIFRLLEIISTNTNVLKKIIKIERIIPAK